MVCTWHSFIHSTFRTPTTKTMSDSAVTSFINSCQGPLGGAEILQGKTDSDRKEVNQKKHTKLTTNRLEGLGARRTWRTRTRDLSEDKGSWLDNGQRRYLDASFSYSLDMESRILYSLYLLLTEYLVQHGLCFLTHPVSCAYRFFSTLSFRSRSGSSASRRTSPPSPR